jgi:tetratricopeptide (TPR) repeat protein
MRLVSTTITANAEATIGRAIASVVAWVDAVVVVDTGATDRTIAIAREAAGAKYVGASFAWVDDFAAARNAALRAAHTDAGGDWAVMVDTDETIDLRGECIRTELARTGAPHLTIAHESGTYEQPRFFRLPAAGRFSGPTHEAYEPAILETRLRRCIFRDEPKSPEDLRLKFSRDVRILREHLKTHRAPRWFYYLGDALQHLGQIDEAIKAWKTCTSLRGWDEEGAWACYRRAQCHVGRAEWDSAIEACAEGLAVHAGIGELAWLAGFAQWRAGRHEQATWWSLHAIALGCYRGCGGDVPRRSFRVPKAHWEGPYDVLRFALRALGSAKGADEAEQSFRAAKAQREAASQLQPVR